MAHLIPAGTDLTDPVDGFAAVARTLAGPSRTGSWVVLVDDLQLLDAASRVLLQQLIRAGVARIIATVRTGADAHPGDPLADFDSTYRIDLAPFDEMQVGLVLRSVLGGPVGRRTTRSLAAASGGNVLYLRELVHGALSAATLVDNGEIWALAEGTMPSTPQLGELIGDRLTSAPPAARTVLELLALSEFLPLADALDLTEIETLVSLEDAELIRVQLDERRSTVTLAHPLYGAALRARIPSLRRRLLLLEQAERAEAHGMRRHDDALHVATWRLAATGTADPRLLFQAAVLARHAHDYQQAATLLQALPDESCSYSDRLLLGEALMQLGDWRDADTTLARAQRSGTDDAQTVAATLMRTTNLFWMAGRNEALRINADAMVGISDPGGRYALKVNEAAMRTISGEPVRGLSVLRGIGADSERASDTNVWSMAAMSEAMGLALTGNCTDAISLARDVHSKHVRLDRQAMDKQAMGPPPSAHLNNLIVALSEAGRISEARQVSERVLTDTATTQELHTWIWAAFFRARTDWFAGDAAAARPWYAEAIAQGQQHNDVQVLHLAWGGLAASAAVLGDIDAAQAALAARVGLPRMGLAMGEERLGEIWLHVARGQLADARAVLADAAASARASGHATSEMLLLTDLARLGGAAEIGERMSEFGEMCDGELSRVRLQFVKSLISGDPAELLTVAEELGHLGAHLLAAEAAATAAGFWRRDADNRRAVAANNQAQRYLSRCPGVGTPALMTLETATLTQREREVALLASQGSSSKDIAATLTLSVRTVDNHLQSAYGKLGVATRGELGAVLTRKS